MTLSNEVLVNITKESSALTLPGFGVPLILASTVPAGFTERLRYYNDAADMLDDGFVETDLAYVQARVALSQRPKPSRVAIGRRATPVAQSQVFTLPADPDNSVTYSITINGTVITTATLDSTSTTAELQAALVAAINASTEAGAVTAANSGADVIVTADEAGIPFTFSIDTTNTADITAGAAVANVGIASDLQAITDEQPDWYCLLLASRDDDEILVAAAQIESQYHLCVVQSNDPAIIDAPYDDENTETDIASRIKGLGYERTAVVYHPDDDEALDAAVVGRCIAEIPGSITWKFKQLAGVTPTQLTATELTNLLSKNANGYRTIAGRSIFYEGTVGSGEFIDNTHGIDKLHSRIQELVFGALLAAPKIPFTQKGLNALAGPIRTAIMESVRDGLIAAERTLPNGDTAPGFTVTPPNIADIPAGDREARRIPASTPFRFEAVLAGAVHKTIINGTLSY